MADFSSAFFANIAFQLVEVVHETVCETVRGRQTYEFDCVTVCETVRGRQTYEFGCVTVYETVRGRETCEFGCPAGR